MNIDHPKAHRVEGLWFDDGNVEIHVQSARYRVYAGILSRESGVLHGIFAPPSLAQGARHEGGHVVLEDVLEVESFPPYPAPTKFIDIYACLRLATKFQVKELRKRALIHLSAPFRTSLRQHETRVSCFREEDRDLVWSESPRFSRIVNWEWSGPPKKLICIAALAREAEALWILPVVFYHLTQLALELGADLYSPSVECDGIAAGLSAADARNISWATWKLVDAATTISDTLRDGVPAERCATPDYCLIRRTEMAGTLLARKEFIQSFSDPLGRWYPHNWDSWCFDNDVCAPCRRVITEKTEKIKAECWDRLPEIYNLPAWEDLELMKRAEIGDCFARRFDENIQVE
ncbi:hypothetical protein MKEN_01024700 [Mycena kentingensis (nom. inval.)]|nr:hypothetical protein MKEN_01024700 [Mycena kentingensis (nom. inval.)]